MESYVDSSSTVENKMQKNNKTQAHISYRDFQLSFLIGHFLIFRGTTHITMDMCIFVKFAIKL